MHAVSGIISRYHSGDVKNRPDPDQIEDPFYEFTQQLEAPADSMFPSNRLRIDQQYNMAVRR